MEKNIKQHFRKLLNDTWEIFVATYPIEFASGFAYFALFGLPSILIIITFLLGFIIDTSLLLNQLREQLSAVIGPESARLLVIITENYIEETSRNFFTGAIYGVTIFLLATQLIVFFQDVLNDVWQIKPNFKSIRQKHYVERGLTFLMVLVTGLLFYLSIGVKMLFEHMGNSEASTFAVMAGISTTLIVFFWFATLYKLLPFAKIPWEPTLVGAAITTLLFFIGMWLLWVFAVEDNVLEDLYDYAAPIVLVSFWIFYNSLAFLFGAAFTRAYADIRGKRMEPKSYAYRFKLVKDDF